MCDLQDKLQDFLEKAQEVFDEAWKTPSTIPYWQLFCDRSTADRKGDRKSSNASFKINRDDFDDNIHLAHIQRVPQLAMELHGKIDGDVLGFLADGLQSLSWDSKPFFSEDHNNYSRESLTPDGVKSIIRRMGINIQIAATTKKSIYLVTHSALNDLAFSAVIELGNTGIVLNHILCDHMTDQQWMLVDSVINRQALMIQLVSEPALLCDDSQSFDREEYRFGARCDFKLAYGAHDAAYLCELP